MTIPGLITATARAETAPGETTLYFTDALGSLEDGNISELGFAFISQTPPTKQNDSQYPPNLFIKNTSRLLPRYQLNADQWLLWFSTAWIMSFLEDSPEFNLSDLFEFLENETLEGYDISLFLPNPFRVVEEYTYNGNESITINGDLTFNTYFSSSIKRPKFRDDVKVGLYSMNINSFIPFPKLIKNTTTTLTPGLFTDIYNQKIIIKNVNYTIKPGESLLFSVEIIPVNKTIPTLIEKYIDVNQIITRWEQRANRWENNSKIPKIQEIGTTIKEFIALIKDSGVNITSEDLAELFNAVISSSFVYDSAAHPSSVTIPARITEEDRRIYYLHQNQMMDQYRPENNESITANIIATPTVWKSEAFNRNKILKVGDATADLYLDHRDLYRILNILRGKINIIVTLYDEDTAIATSQKDLDRTGILDLLTKPTTPITFTFTGDDKEIPYGHSIGIGVSLKNETKIWLRTVDLLYDSTLYPSALRVKFEETQNIKISDVTTTPANGQIIPGGTIEYILNVTSEKDDVLTISTREKETTGIWDVTVPTSIEITAKNTTAIHVVLTSETNTKEAYGDNTNVIITISGTTGIAKQEVFAEVTKDAIQYNVEILGYTNSINIDKGENRTFYFVIKNNNTGATDDVDSYTITASSKNQWPLIPRETIRNLRRGDSTKTEEARVVIHVPKNTTLESDVITITVTSEDNSSAFARINITVLVIGDDLLESIYNLFDSVAESLGLNDMFGSLGAIVLVSIIMVIILFLLIILALVLTTKDVQIICTHRIKEIEATDKAVFELTLKNPTKRQKTYEIITEQNDSLLAWTITREPETLTVDAHQLKTAQITVTPPDNIQSDDWVNITVNVKKTGKKKTEHITLMAMIKKGNTLLSLSDVTHYPAEFNPGELVTTSCNVSNNGTISARNVKVFFYLNGKQKNIAEVTIPAGSVAEIQIPWIAVKGKNQIRLRLKEQ
jgi:hypothetical protein